MTGMPPITFREERCYWCGHAPHPVDEACGALTYFTKRPCECLARPARACVECGRPVEVVEGRPVHRIPRADVQEQVSSAAARARYGAELGFFFLRTADHEARIA